MQKKEDDRKEEEDEEEEELHGDLGDKKKKKKKKKKGINSKFDTKAIPLLEVGTISEKEGRGVRARVNIEPGTLLVSEKPYCYNIFDRHKGMT